jgi:hypothetical protein
MFHAREVNLVQAGSSTTENMLRALDGYISTPPNTVEDSSAGTPDLSGRAMSRTGRCRTNPAFRVVVTRCAPPGSFMRKKFARLIIGKAYV